MKEILEKKSKEKWKEVQLCPNHKRYSSSFGSFEAGWHNDCGSTWSCIKELFWVCVGCKERTIVKKGEKKECFNCK